MTKEEKIQYYNERIVGCNHLILIGANPVRWMNHKKQWEYRIKQLQKESE